MPVPIDGPAGRNEVTDEYRDNYDRIFSGTSVSTFCGQCGVTEKCKDCTPQCDHNGKSPSGDLSGHPDFDNCTRCIHGKVPPKVSPCRECLIATGKGIDGLHWTPKKSKKDGGKNAKSNS